MPSVTFDGRSFMLDGRRIWLVSGSIDYFRIPRELWADRIHAAKQSGFNTIAVSVVWARCEPRPGQFDFSGDNDIRHFIHLIGEAGLWCVLRPGPFVGAGLDCGGLPAWLGSLPNVAMRTSNGPYLEACSRYVTAVAEQVRSQQVTSPGKGGPILLVQNENSWTCGHAGLAQGYLGEINRYLREAGFTVPTINANNLWQGVEGEVDCWVGGPRLMATMRELAVVRPTQPRVVIDVEVSPTASWGEEPTGLSGPVVVRRLAEILAGGGQFNVSNLHGGTNFGFSAGRLMDGAEWYAATSPGPFAPLGETGAPSEILPYVRRITTFATRFSRVLANLDPSYQPVVLEPGDGAASGRGKSESTEPGPAVIPLIGSQGGVTFVFGGASDVSTVTLVLGSGVRLPTPIGAQGVAWVLLDVPITSRAVLDYCTLSALGAVGNVLVCFGPAGTEGVVSINGSPVAVQVPTERTPLVIKQEGITVVVCNENLVDETFITETAAYVGVAGVRADGTPVATEQAYAKIDSEGVVTTVPAAGRRPRSAPRAAIAGWTAATMDDYIKGTSERFAVIDGPADLATLGAPYGYGWYRISIKRPSAKRVKLAIPQGMDRFHLFHDGRDLGVIGRGPGASREVNSAMKRGDQTLVVLAENLGRVAGGSDLGEGKGLLGHMWEVTPMSVSKPMVREGTPVDVLAFRAPLWEVAEGDMTSPDRLTWTFRHTKKAPVFMHIAHPVARSLLLLNDRPVKYLGRSSAGYVCFWPEDLGRGVNTVQLAFVADGAGLSSDAHELDQMAAKLASSVTFWIGTGSATAKADWAFARWEAPLASAFGPVLKAPDRVGPTWCKTMFKAADTHLPLMLELAGMTKGQIYLNGRHVGRYFVATGNGERVGPQSRYYLPEPWVHAGGDNELLLFDEHGADPSKVRLLYDVSAQVVRA